MSLQKFKSKSNYSKNEPLGSMPMSRNIQKQVPNSSTNSHFILPSENLNQIGSKSFSVARQSQYQKSNPEPLSISNQRNYCNLKLIGKNDYYRKQLINQMFSNQKKIQADESNESNESQSDNNERQSSPEENHLERSRQKIFKGVTRAERDILIQKQRDYGQQTFNMALFILRRMSQRQSKRQLTSLFIDGQYRTEVGISQKGTQTKGLLIYNLHGSIRFKDPVNLMKFSKKRLRQLVSISHRDIKIHEPELMYKICDIQLQDYFEQGDNIKTQRIKNMEWQSSSYQYYSQSNTATFKDYIFRS